MREYEQEQLRVAGQADGVARRSWTTCRSGGSGKPRRSPSAPKPEPAYTKQDFEQSLALVQMPVAARPPGALRQARPTSPWPAPPRRELGPAASALQVMANSKKDPKNQAAMLAPVPDIQAAQTTLQVVAAGDKAQAMWHEAFQYAMAIVDNASRLPVADPDANLKSGDDVEQRDHDLLVSSVKPTAAAPAGQDRRARPTSTSTPRPSPRARRRCPRSAPSTSPSSSPRSPTSTAASRRSRPSP